MLKITVTTKSDTLFASSEGSAMIDAITRHRKNGLPYIPGKTMKGLLKESAMEVSEIIEAGIKHDDSKIIWDKYSKLINDIFGDEGGKNGLLTFDDLEHIESKEWKEPIDKCFLPANSVLNYFTTIRHQTAMHNGVAKDGSLRTYKCLKQGQQFELCFDHSLNDDQKQILEKACLNLRRVGSNRNRGFGVIEVKLEPYQTNGNKNQNNPVSSNILKITLLTPALLPTRSGDANIVSSDKIISGRKILGMLAAQYMKTFKGDVTKLHEDPTFKNIFLNGNVTFSDAYPCKEDQIFFPIGQHWVTNKAKNRVYNEFDIAAKENSKTYGGFANNIGNQKTSVSTVLDFHNSRNKVNQDGEKINTRISGTNSGNGIYYYESLEAGQEFVFKIDALPKHLVEIYKAINNATDLRLGKAVNTALGKIKIENFEGTWPSQDTTQSECILTFISPVILKDDQGEYIPSISVLEKYLEVKIEESRIRTTKVQVNQSNINMQFPEMLAIAAGSSIKITGVSQDKVKDESIGEFTHEGFGRFILEEVKNDVKKDNLEFLLKKEEEKSNNKIDFEKANKDEYKNTKIVKYALTHDEIMKAGKAGNADGKKLHKNTTKRMLDLCREIQYILSDKITFIDAFKLTLSAELEKAPYSIKIIQNLVEHYNIKNSGTKKDNKNPDGSPEELNYEKLRKKDLPKFKEDFIREFRLVIKNKLKQYESNEAKLAYLKAFFNKAKIENRNDSSSK